MSTIDHPKSQELFAAAKDGQLDIVKVLFKEFNPNATDEDMLQWAVRRNSIKIVVGLLAAGANVHAENEHALYIASIKNHQKIVKVLLAAGANPRNQYRNTLYYTVYNGNIGVVRLLLVAGAPVGNALNLAAEFNYFEIVKLLLEFGANPRDALHTAAKKGYLEIVKVLLAAGADPYLAVLSKASENGHPEVVKVLLAAGADARSNSYPLTWAAANNHLEVVKVLLAAGADPYSDRSHALQWSAENGHFGVVKVLRALCTGYHAFNEQALRLAIDKKRPITSKILFEAGNGDRKFGIDILSSIMLIGYVITKEFLATYDNPHKLADNCLQNAACRGDLNSVNNWLDVGANPRADDHYAVRYAILRGYFDVAKSLITHYTINELQSAQKTLRSPLLSSAIEQYRPHGSCTKAALRDI